MYDGYGYGIQRADAMRLFFLHKHGGIYIDLDIECRRSLDFLRHYPWVMPKVSFLQDRGLVLCCRDCCKYFDCLVCAATARGWHVQR